MKRCDVCGGTFKHINNKIIRCEFCGRLCALEGDNVKDANSEEVYSEAKYLSSQSSVKDKTLAADLFDALGKYKDSCELAERTRHKIEEEKRRLQEEEIRRQNEEKERIKKEKAAKQGKTFFSAALLFLIVGASGYYFYSSYNKALQEKQAKYDSAMDAYEKKDYDTAISIFNSIADYEDSQVIVKQVIDTKNAELYKQASELLKVEEYDKAKEIFDSLGDYSDSVVRAKNAIEEKKKKQYLMAKDSKNYITTIL